MKILKILSNNAIVVRDDHGEISVALGKGIGFGKKPGDSADSRTFETQFLQKGNNVDNVYQQIFSKIPDDIIQVTRDIVAMTEKEFQILSPLSLLLTLSDHLYFAMTRSQNKIHLRSPLNWDLKVFYPKEYQLAEKAVQLINTTLSADLPEDEAAFISLHIISSHQNANIQDTMSSAELVKDILKIIKIQLKLQLNEKSLEFQRIVTHLKFFSLRMINRDYLSIGDDTIYTDIREKLTLSYHCAEKIKQWISLHHNYSMTLDEMMFLTIHIERLRESSLRGNP
ncbi:hypothetical protein HA49_15190 [Tatumella morbirosei]|uniref:PRD domain-containing protein n=1 Tax=Tatumella morbirosei TaxID=642227 RepID=A0A095T5D5_9GAMM|nr:PRD domain-containing protein [Tatumella morbirosei]KGD72116.1 hypothetical protein HA49_15190 [Tatumella morbirosei]